MEKQENNNITLSRAMAIKVIGGQWNVSGDINAMCNFKDEISEE